MSKPVTNPTKSDLFAALNSYNINKYGSDRYESNKLKQLIEKEERADEAFEKFKCTNKEYKKLHDESTKAQKERHDIESIENAFIIKKMRKIRNAIYTKGVTPQTISMVEKFVEDLDSQ